MAAVASRDDEAAPANDVATAPVAVITRSNPARFPTPFRNITAMAQHCHGCHEGFKRFLANRTHLVVLPPRLAESLAVAGAVGVGAASSGASVATSEIGFLRVLLVTGRGVAVLGFVAGAGPRQAPSKPQFPVHSAASIRRALGISVLII